ncbi:MAG: radical SAM protein [Rhodospirillaceae bacterium TMED8]|nr:radical SAM protein [Magnetovibrio sp.]OUT53218.1 MAG: radical SAM protein [Rhodospirillaceae bacterium TMED8]|tara:strand:+ start:1233 stop:2177 length:945 start_codon:yes stop_codon:yes gene_type:complete
MYSKLRPSIDKFEDPMITATGEERAVVRLIRLRTLWFNTGSLCNIQCANCYMDSSPTNDELTYLTLEDVRGYLTELASGEYSVEEVAFTGGEPFMNRELPYMLSESLVRGYRTLVLTNAMKPLQQKQSQLLDLHQCYGNELVIRVSLDHFSQKYHDHVRGTGSWACAMEGLRWLTENRLNITIAGRTCWDETEEDVRLGFASLFKDQNIRVDAFNPASLVLFPEMAMEADVPEITTNCWDLLGVKPDTIMCATSRMVIRRKGRKSPNIVPCTLLPYDTEFDLGEDLSNSATSVRLNHPYCARFCVLGGASCSTI